MPDKYVPLEEILPDFVVNFERYWESEAVITQLLKDKDYGVFGKWFTGDGDSFGPLTRCLRVAKDGDRFIIVYG